jgi:tRNA pseudouridine13 synthase
MRLMYLHAYQSFVWNSAVSKRIEMFGLQPCVGDLVQTKKSRQQRIHDKKEANDNDGVSYITEENVHEFTIEDVVLPLPGHSVLYPKNQSIVFLISLFGEVQFKNGLDF